MSDGMYGKRARLYDLIYSGKDYAAEAAALCDILVEHGVEQGARVLEAACGTGNYLEHLVDTYEVSGFDLSSEMIDLGRQKLPDVEFFLADIFAFESERTYDAVLCLFSSLSYAESFEQLEQAARNFYRARQRGRLLHESARGVSLHER